MPTSLALCLDGPMQSWGIGSRFTVRDTATEPTKSGIVGLLGAAMGMTRDDHTTLARLADLRLGIRVDQAGRMERDYHTAQDVPTTSGRGHRTIVSERYYLADAVFLAVLTGEPELLTNLDRAVRSPRWPLCLGRKAFTLSRPLTMAGVPGEPPSGWGLSDAPAADVLREHPWLVVAKPARDSGTHLRTVADCDPDTPGAELRHDHPLSFTRGDRRFGTRTVLAGDVPIPTDVRTAASPGEQACS